MSDDLTPQRSKVEIKKEIEALTRRGGPTLDAAEVKHLVELVRELEKVSGGGTVTIMG